MIYILSFSEGNLSLTFKIQITEDEVIPLNLSLLDTTDLQIRDSKREEEMITAILTTDLGCLRNNYTISVHTFSNCSMVILRGFLSDVNKAIGYVTYTPELDWSGRLGIKFEAVGSHSPDETITSNISILVTAVNDLPQFYYENRLLKSIPGEMGISLVSMNSEDHPSVLGMKTVAGTQSAIFQNISVIDSDSVYLSGVVTVSGGFIGVRGSGSGGADDMGRGSSIAINATGQELSASLQALEFSSPMETFLMTVSYFY